MPKITLPFLHAANPKLYRKMYADAYRELNRDKARLYASNWRHLYRSRGLVMIKDWKRRNPEKVSAQQARHRARASAE